MAEVLKVEINYNPNQFSYEHDSKSFGDEEELIEYVLKDFMKTNKVEMNDFNNDDNFAILSAVDNGLSLLYYDFKKIDLFKVIWDFDSENNMTLTVIRLNDNFPVLEKYNNMTLKEFVEKLNIALKENFTKDDKDFVKIRDVQQLENNYNHMASLKLNTNFYFSFTKNDVFVNGYRKAPLLKMCRKIKETGFRNKEMFLYSIEIIDYSNDEKLSSLISKTSKELHEITENERVEEEQLKKNKMTKDYDEFIEVLNKHNLSIETFSELYKKFEGLSSQVQKELL